MCQNTEGACKSIFKAFTNNVCIIVLLKSEAFQRKERGEIIPVVSFNVTDKALRIQEAKSKVSTYHQPLYMYTVIFYLFGVQNILYLHSLHYISYCTDEKNEGNNIFAYIARESGTKAQTCYVLEVDNLVSSSLFRLPYGLGEHYSIALCVLITCDQVWKNHAGLVYFVTM